MRFEYSAYKRKCGFTFRHEPERALSFAVFPNSVCIATGVLMILGPVGRFAGAFSPVNVCDFDAWQRWYVCRPWLCFFGCLGGCYHDYQTFVTHIHAGATSVLADIVQAPNAIQKEQTAAPLDSKEIPRLWLACPYPHVLAKDPAFAVDVKYSLLHASHCIR